MTHPLLPLLLWIWVICDCGVVQTGPNQGKQWIHWWDTETGREWVEEDPTLYGGKGTVTQKNWSN